MLRSKLYDVFIALPTSARRDLRQWVKSPFFNTRADVTELYVYMDSHALRDVTNLKKEVVYKALYGDLPYDDNKMRYIMSFLLRVIEQYLIYQQAVATPEKADLLLSQSYKDLNIEKHFGQSMERLRENLRKSHTNSSMLFLEYEVEKMNFEFLDEKKRVSTDNMQVILDSLDRYYVAEKLKVACSALTYQSIFKHEFDVGIVTPLLEMIEKREWHKTISAIGAYYYAYRLATEADSETYFFLLKEQLVKLKQVVSKDELLTIYRLAINYAIRRSNNGDESYQRELFELYKDSIESGILIENGELSAFAYKNVVTIGLRLSEYEYVDKFMQEYRLLLNSEHRKSYYDYCRALWLIALGRYSEGMPILSQINYGDIFLQLNANAALIKVYYEIDEFDALSSLLDSFKQLLHRKKDIIGYHLQNYLNLIRFVTRLLSATKTNTVAYNRLEEEIQTATPLSERKWLLAQLSQL